MHDSAEQAAIRFTAVSARVLHLLQQFAFRPWRFTSCVPLLKHGDGLVVGEVEAPHDAATDSKRPKISMLASDRGLDRPEKSSSALHAVVEGA